MAAEYDSPIYNDKYNRKNYQPELRTRINKKLIDLQSQLLDHYGGRNHLNDMDLVRYSAMVEVLKAVLQ